MLTVRQLLAAKPSGDVHSIDPDRSTYEALQMMAEHNIGAVLVRSGGELLGILTEREYARRIALEGKKSRHTPVRDTMNPNLVTVGPDTTLDECMNLMTDERTRYLPVLEDGRLVGLISIGDVVKGIIEEQRININQLQTYINGV